jgi:hypothetical protein
MNAERARQIRAVCDTIEHRVQAKHMVGIDPAGAMRTVIEAFAELHVDALKEIEWANRRGRQWADVPPWSTEREEWYAP